MILVKIDNRIVRAIKALTYLLLLFSVVTKLFCIPYISHKFHLLGIGDFCRVLGVIELIGVVLFFYESTFGLGLILLCSYFGGAIATDIHSPEYIYQPLTVITFILVSAFVRNPGIFHKRLQINHESDQLTVSLQK